MLDDIKKTLWDKPLVLGLIFVKYISDSHQRVKPEGVSSMNFVIPAPRMLKAFAMLVKPIFERVAHNTGEAQPSATLPDTLLPRLIYGQLCLSEAQALFEEACA